MATIIVGTVVLLVVAAIVVRMIKNKRSGKSSCGGDCSCCKGCH